MLEFSNAFNNISRSCMFNEIRERIPSLSPWMESCYGGRSILHLGEEKILSCCRVQQGDPLVPLGFALALQPVVERIKAEVPGLKLNAWYLDDGTLCGSPADLMAALRIVEQDGPPRGLNLNHMKSALHSSGLRPLPQCSSTGHSHHKGWLLSLGLSNWSFLILR